MKLNNRKNHSLFFLLFEGARICCKRWTLCESGNLFID